MGTFAHLDPRVEEYVAEQLGLAPEPVSTQIIPRDRHAAFFATLGVIASGIERLATEVRHLQRSEVREAEEFFHPGQKGSSSMPHKRNPVLSENLTGLARVVRAAVVPALENVTLWHERDISHSSVERVIAPDTTIALDFALGRLAGMMQRLVVYPERMRANLESLGGVVHSGAVLMALTRAGILREDAYRIVQRCAMATWEKLGTAGRPEFPRQPAGGSGGGGADFAGGPGCGDGPGVAYAGGGPDLCSRVRGSVTASGCRAKAAVVTGWLTSRGVWLPPHTGAELPSGSGDLPFPAALSRSASKARRPRRRFGSSISGSVEVLTGKRGPRRSVARRSVSMRLSHGLGRFRLPRMANN